jgi:hypothetical protein
MRRKVMDMVRMFARILLPERVAGRVPALLILPAALLLSGWVLAQPLSPPYSFVFDVYKQSAFEPNSFDSWFKQNRARFDDPRFSTCFGHLYSRWSKQAAKDKAICDQHTDPSWQTKCNSESRAQYYFFWASSLRQFLNTGKGWVETDAGEVNAEAWQRCKLVSGGCEMLREALEKGLVTYRQDMTCQ